MAHKKVGSKLTIDLLRENALDYVKEVKDTQVLRPYEHFLLSFPSKVFEFRLRVRCE